MQFQILILTILAAGLAYFVYYAIPDQDQTFLFESLFITDKHELTYTSEVSKHEIYRSLMTLNHEHYASHYFNRPNEESIIFFSIVGNLGQFV